MQSVFDLLDAQDAERYAPGDGRLAEVSCRVKS
jgi:hypothetical protein